LFVDRSLREAVPRAAKKEAEVSVVAVIVIVVVAVLLVAMLIAGGRRAAAARAHAEPSAVDYDAQPFRSHAEASRRRGGEGKP
jgi:hypothetical protein